jgi:hypothetical protein
VACFAVSRFVYFVAGVRFDTAPLGRYFQFADPDLLEHRLLETLWYLHSQPPLFNAFLGVVLKTAGDSRTAFALLYLLVGLALTLALYALLVALGLGRWAAAAVAVAYAISPPAIVFENLLFYDYPVTAMLVGSALALHWFVRRPTFLRGLAFFGLVAALVLTRSVFQLAFVVLALAVAAVACRQPRVIVAAAALPIALVLTVYAKNLAEFGTFATSSWYGMSLAATTTPNIPRPELETMVREGHVSSLVLVYPFSTLEAFPTSYTFPEVRGVRVLDRARYAPTGQNNYNHSAYLAISKQYFRDWRYLVRHRPGAYLTGVENGARVFFDPATRLPAFERNGNLAALGEWHDLYTRALFSAVRLGIRFRLISILWVLTFAYATVRLAFWLRDRTLAPAKRATLAYIWLATLYVVAVWVTTDVAETFRARATLEPLVLFVLLPYCVLDAVSLVRAR